MKIGIITHYYKSTNYGGNLQAYALCKYINNMGLDVEQISFEYEKRSLVEQFKECSLKDKILKTMKYIVKIIKRTYLKIIPNKEQEYISSRKKAMIDFNINLILHSDIIYGSRNIKEAAQCYDIFITGSDQVWNLEWFQSAFFLDFVPPTKRKISYAASVSMDSLTAAQLKVFERNLSDFYAVSVREQSTVSLIQDICPIPVTCTLDPTLLLEKDEWEEIVAERIVQEEYVFCYFLGNREKQRQLATEFAKKNNVKLVNIPYLNKNCWREDKNFGDIQLNDISPQKWISLIKYAKYVFTDSFHAVVFSCIYEKQYFVFNRYEGKEHSMSSRIYSLINMYDTEGRFCDIAEKENVEYVESLKDIDYTKEFEELKLRKKISKEFLSKNICYKRESNI